MREVGGFDLLQLPIVDTSPVARLPRYVPIVFHGYRRIDSLRSSAVAVPLRQLMCLRTGKLRYRTKKEVLSALKIQLSAELIVDGIADDRFLEPYWSEGRAADIEHQLGQLSPILVIPPNFSVFIDVPRSDNLHNRKRIAIASVDLAQAGLPVAVPINSRTEADFAAWAAFYRRQENLNCVAYEFATGARGHRRGMWHVQQLKLFAKAVDRPLQLVMRGGRRFLRELLGAFANVTCLDSNAHMKAINRKRLVPGGCGKVVTVDSMTLLEQSVDGLMAENTLVMERACTVLDSTETRLTHESE